MRNGIFSGLVVCLSIVATTSFGIGSPETVLSRGPHHRVVETIADAPSVDGGVIRHTNRFTELGNGLSYLGETGEWLASEETIELLENGGATARQGQHKVVFPPTSLGEIDFMTSDGKRFVSRPVWLAYYDAESGESLLIAGIKESVGAVRGNQVVYADAFSGVKANLVFTYRIGSFEQDVVLLEDPPLPQGFNEATTRLQLWTEFTEYPAVAKEEYVVKGESDAARRQAMASPDLTDSILRFGQMEFARGKAFMVDDNGAGRVGRNANEELQV